MPVRMVRIRHMWMAVLHGLVLMPVAVCPRRHRLMVMEVMEVMAIVMPVRMFVHQPFMHMLVLMRFHEVQHDARAHQQTPDQHAPAA